MSKTAQNNLLEQHRSVLASSLESLTAQTSGPETSLRTDLNGVQLKLPNNSQIFLIDGGFKRFIPDPPTYQNLFIPTASVVIDIDVDEITSGTAIATGAVLAKASNGDGIYVIDFAPTGTTLTKRLIVSPAVLSEYQFNGNAVVVVPPVVLAAIPDGPPMLPPS